MIPTSGSKNAPKLDALDLEIIALLQEDGRRSNTDIARQLRLSEATIRKRIDRLVADKTIRVSAWADPLRLGYNTYANIEIRVHPPFLEEAAASIAQFPEIFFLGICTGNFDILAVGLFHSNEHMYEFLSARLAKVRGIDRASTSHIIRTIKRDFPRPGIETLSAPRKGTVAKQPSGPARDAVGAVPVFASESSRAGKKLSP
jgi:Lrp/AsnC family transcriptional regulator, regulator for asnA, asnC and gidA